MTKGSVRTDLLGRILQERAERGIGGILQREPP